jgi:hypothetical protein
MNAAARLAGFAGVLLLLFAGAAVAGGAIGPDRDGERPAAAHGGGHGATGAEAGVDSVRGLAVSAGGLALALEQTELPRGRASELSFGIVDAGGRRVRDFEVGHEKRMHLIVVRRDGKGFQHLHPELGADGIWRVRLTLPDAGAYRVFADFKRGGKARTLAADLAVDGDADYGPLPAPATTADAGGGYEVRLDAGRVRAGHDAELRFTVSRDGRTVRTEPYLGAGGHLVALREGDLAYLHVHPGGHGDEGHDDAVAFASEFPSAGRYRLFLQFKHEGRVRTAEFTHEVSR